MAFEGTGDAAMYVVDACHVLFPSGNFTDVFDTDTETQTFPDAAPSLNQELLQGITEQYILSIPFDISTEGSFHPFSRESSRK